ncbi:prephenate dehydrogenase [Aureliella helgolandensis]|uniref:Prephenate dehydrogenase n=1 Tax=Aureliella helgolandensis TaxID=2527968 RepID=A0A518G1J7_9BACT|nr:prephenate dehydrogenase/arogenate dehydrogenase family protein [Aureliella helgolandensis]QDV22478.1 prephenate dehydrogenase [Aureliella helgolandensis]
MVKFERVVLVGVGLLGGSLGMALRDRELAGCVVGVGRRETPLREALALGALDEFTLNLSEACQNADLAIICTPVQLVADQIRACRAAMPAGGLITDVGSTKATICQVFEEENGSHPQHAAGTTAQFCGSHPLAGSDKSGVAFAEADLFVDKLTVVTPMAQTPEAAIQQTEALWQAMGSRTARMTPEQHDEAVARTSHLPHLVASALAAATPDAVLPLAASGWRDTTRVAAGNVEMWRQIVTENHGPVLEALNDFSGQLQQWIAALESGDNERLEKLLVAGKQKRDSVGN